MASSMWKFTEIVDSYKIEGGSCLGLTNPEVNIKRMHQLYTAHVCTKFILRMPLSPSEKSDDVFYIWKLEGK